MGWMKRGREGARLRHTHNAQPSQPSPPSSNCYYAVRGQKLDLEGVVVVFCLLPPSPPALARSGSSVEQLRASNFFFLVAYPFAFPQLPPSNPGPGKHVLH